jgi:flagellar biosynthesis/type III secretory pathway protein FliH
MKLAENLDFDIDRFRGQRALLQGAPGAGKSNGARLILEATYGTFQHLILDVEDEFHTLRTGSRDYAIIGGDYGDAPLGRAEDAGTLALTLLSLGVSTVMQIGDLTLSAKRHFVGEFVAGMMRAKADLWHPTIVMLDETHNFVPQQGVEVSSEAVTHLATAGRKRGFSAIFATQRLSLINKDVLGVCENKFLGRIEQSADRRAVADLLGFGNRAQEALEMQAFKAGEFYAVGPSLSAVPVRARLLKAETQAPEPGTTVIPTPAPAAIQKALAALAKAAEKQEADTVATNEKPEPLADTANLPKTMTEFKTALRQEYQRGRGDAEVHAESEFERGKIEGREEGYQEGYLAARNALTEHFGGMVREVADKILSQAGGKAEDIVVPHPAIVHATPPLGEMKPATQRAINGLADAAVRQIRKQSTDGQVRLLEAIAPNPPAPVNWAGAAIRAGYSPNGGGFRSARKQLIETGKVVEGPDGILSTPYALETGPAPSREELIDLWSNKLGEGPGKCLRTIAALDGIASTGQIADANGYAATGGGFRKAMKELRSSGTVTQTSAGYRLSDAFLMAVGASA